jgi:tetratricopeptide (TPR) repeat protein
VHAVGTLKGYAFLQEREDAETFDVHRLVHLATRGWIDGEGSTERVRSAAVAHLATVFDTDDWARRKRLRQSMPHVLKIIQSDASKPDCGGDECHLGYWAGRCLQVEGRIGEAVELLERVVAAWTRTLAEDHSSRLASQHALGIAYRANGQVKEAVELLEHVVAVKATFMSPGHPSRIVSEEMLAWMRSEAAEWAHLLESACIRTATNMEDLQDGR